MKLLNLKKIILAFGLSLLFSRGVLAVNCTPNTSLVNAVGQTCTNFTNNATGITIQNDGTIGVTTSSINAINNANTGTITSVVNTGTIGDGSSYNGIYTDLGTFGTITNSGTIQSAAANGINIRTATSITNSGTIIVTGTGTNAIYTRGLVGTITNTGTIAGRTSGIITGGTITTLNNSGAISAAGVSGGRSYSTAGVDVNAVITTLTNTGSIRGTDIGINNASVITTLNNSQGGNSSSAATTALTYKGALPTNYSILINSTTNYGQLAVTSGSGATAFGIYTGSVISTNRYASVFTGVTGSNFSVSSGTYNGLTWNLSQVGTSGVWDLLFPTYVFVPSTPNTQQSLVNTAQVLQGTVTILNTALTNSLSYDCNEFGANNICVSAGGRNTAVSAANGLNNTSALLIAAYRPHANYRIGAYADQNLSVNNAGSTVNLGNNTPLLGVFGAWNERLDGTGTEVKVSAAYGQKNTTVTRSVVGTSEAGSGGAPINSQGAQVTAKYGFGIVENVIVSPYVGMRYTQNNMNGYTESASSSVTAPLTYSALNTNATTALAGVGASYKFIPQAVVFASAGVETDTNTANGSYSATGVSGLTAINFNANPVRTRPTATVGAYYDVVKNQRLGVTGIYRQEPYQAVSTTTVMATYTVGL